MRLIKVAIIGAGSIAEEHIKSFLETKKVQIVGIFSKTLSKANKLKNKYKISKVYKSLDDLYYGTKSDLVVVAVSIINVKKVLKKVSKYNWYCLCEKPIGINFEETIKISKFFKNKNKFFIALNRRCYDSTLQAKNLLKYDNSKRLIFINDQEDIVKAKKFHPKIICKNFMYANSIHLVDYCKIFARGSVVRFNNLVNFYNKDYGLLSKEIIFNSGDKVLFTSLWNRPGPWFVKIITKNLFISLEPLEKILVRTDLRVKLKKIKYKKKIKDGFYNQALNMINIITNKKKTLPNLNDAIDTTLLVKKIFKDFKVKT
jgi:hypothetical protein